MIVIVMGVSGAGKSTVGQALAHELGWRFIDADDHHPPENVAKMAAGMPLTDQDRQPWLEALNSMLRNEANAVLACSALKEKYRRQLAAGIERLQVVFLNGERDLIRARLARRAHRYMPATLLGSQFDALEPPIGAISVDVSADVHTCVASILGQLRA